MQGIGYRRFLPILVLVIMAALLLTHALEWRLRHQEPPDMTARSAAVLDPILDNYDLPIALGIVTALAAPGLLPFAFLGYSPLADNLHTPLCIAIILMLTLLAWYAAGRWIDRRLGYVAKRPPFPGSLQQVLNWTVLAAWIMAVSAVTAELIAIDFMAVMQWMAAGIAGWGAFTTLTLICRIREQRRYTRELAGRAPDRVGAG